MQRRKLLSAMSSGLVVASAGCMGYEVQSSEDVDKRKEKISSQETEIGELEDELDSAQSRQTELENQISEVESELEGSNSEQILFLYSWGLTHSNNGWDAYREGYNFGQNDNYSEARAEFNLASGYFHSAENNFRAAEERAIEMGKTAVETYTSDAKTSAKLMKQAMGNYQIAAAYMIEGDRSTARDYSSTGDSKYSQAQNHETRDLDRLENELDVTIDT